MSVFSLVAAIAVAQGAVSVENLPIGRPGSWLVSPGRMTDLNTYDSATADDVAKAARGKRFVFLGENHATPPHQQMEADIIEALARDGRQVIIGLEMYQRPKQSFLDSYVAGDLRESDFLKQSDWKGQWGFDFGFYRPVFDSALRHKFPILGLNIPRDYVRAVARGGFAGLTEDQKKELAPNMSLDNKEHRSVFDALMGGHPGMSNAAMDNTYAAQVLWDESMADTVVRHMAAHKPRGNTVYVIIAGSGHIMYGQGIDYRLERRGFGTGTIVVMTQSNEPLRVSNGIGDFVYVTPKQAS